MSKNKKLESMINQQIQSLDDKSLISDGYYRVLEIYNVGDDN